VSRYPDAWSAVRGNPWRFLTSAWPWRSLAYLFSTVPLGIVAFLVLAVVVGLGLLTAVIVVGLVLLASLPLVTTVVAEIERARLRLVLPKPSARETTPLQERLRTWRTLPVSWSEIGYVVLLATVFWLVDAAVLMLAISTPVVLILAPVLVRRETIEVAGWRIDTTAEAWPAVALGLLTLPAAAYLLTGLASGQAALTRLLLDPPEARLVAAVTELRRSRAGLVDAFEIERRRIERDLHDGTQQRLVALTMALGQAELELADGPALDLVTKAHALADDALEDLRATVRGIHPQVLTDHGLAAAIHELADRSPVPADTDLHVGGRLPAPVETAAYFLVSEAVTNIARHSGAHTAQIHAWVADATLTVTVVDDGHGGADPARGTGLAGLAARIDAIDGTLDITSPPGGPTQVRMTCPIADH
jgi:signal transduction histidine kinase